ncbi:hypothetical protein E3N88_19171 [Mikania micrantha]|uniref:Uncharacterized protein n=1 Tax=Mikania micrantha TaxID=192012 RepID=A0A5N6NPT5_9ASTR|nr:hypothetical protein E3N88_19171 [Mikania micrantha]
MMIRKLRLLFRVLIIAILMQFGTVIVVVGKPQVPCNFIFGDSFVDPGNNNLLLTLAKANYAPYGIDFPQGVTGRATNGFTIADFIARLLGFVNFIPPYATATNAQIARGVNYGSAGSGIQDQTGSNLGMVLSLRNQLIRHAAIVARLTLLQRNITFTKQYLKQCVYVVDSGTNDYFAYFTPGINSTYTPDQFAAYLINQYSNRLKFLYQLGARKIAVFGLGLIGCSPAEITLLGTNGAPCVEPLNNAVKLFNDRLKPLVDTLNSELNNARFTFINISNFYAAPDVSGLSKVPCCTLLPNGLCVPNSTPCPNRNLTFYYDGFHPTEIVNRFHASRSYNAASPMDASPYDISHLAQLN